MSLIPRKRDLIKYTILGRESKLFSDLGVKVDNLTVFTFKAFFLVDYQIDHKFSLSTTLLIIEMTSTMFKTKVKPLCRAS